MTSLLSSLLLSPPLSIELLCHSEQINHPGPLSPALSSLHVAAGCAACWVSLQPRWPGLILTCTSCVPGDPDLVLHTWLQTPGTWCAWCTCSPGDDTQWPDLVTTNSFTLTGSPIPPQQSTPPRWARERNHLQRIHSSALKATLTIWLLLTWWERRRGEWTFSFVNHGGC